MRTGHCLFLTLGILLELGCGSGQQSGVASAMRSDVSRMRSPQAVTLGKAPSPQAAGAAPALRLASSDSPTPPAIQERSIIRNGDLAVRVKDIEPAEHQIEQYVASEGGYVDSASSTDLASDHPEIKISLRVPVSTFESTVAKIESMGVRLSKTINSQDVTGQLIDLDARLTTMAAEENVYQGLLRQAGSLDTAIQLRDKLTELRSQIESIAGQRKSMSSLAALSTISATFTQSAMAAAPAQDASWLQETWGQASSFALAAARIVASLFIWILALSPFWLPAGLISRRIVSKARVQGATLQAPRSTIL